MNIGITTRTTTLNKAKINYIPSTYLNVIKDYGYPIIIDSSISIKSTNEFEQQLKNIDAFILPGGTNINYIDLYIINYCYKNDIPLLGICLGMQEISYYFNNNSLQPLNTLSHFNMRKKYLHKITLDNNSSLYKILKRKNIKVNSRHKFKISEDPHYSIEATHEDVIEAIKVKDRKCILGIQFHPEIMYEYDRYAKKLFDYFFSFANNE